MTSHRDFGFIQGTPSTRARAHTHTIKCHSAVEQSATLGDEADDQSNDEEDQY